MSQVSGTRGRLSSREAFQLSTFIGITQEAAVNVHSQSKDIIGAEVVIRNVQLASTPATPAVLEPENIVKGKLFAECRALSVG